MRDFKVPWNLIYVNLLGIKYKNLIEGFENAKMQYIWENFQMILIKMSFKKFFVYLVCSAYVVFSRRILVIK